MIHMGIMMQVFDMGGAYHRLPRCFPILIDGELPCQSGHREETLMTSFASSYQLALPQLLAVRHINELHGKSAPVPIDKEVAGIAANGPHILGAIFFEAFRSIHYRSRSFKRGDIANGRGGMAPFTRQAT